MAQYSRRWAFLIAFTIAFEPSNPLLLFSECNEYERLIQRSIPQGTINMSQRYDPAPIVHRTTPERGFIVVGSDDNHPFRISRFSDHQIHNMLEFFNCYICRRGTHLFE